jgi:hypothetical protein
MQCLTRKIAKAKWEAGTAGEVPAEAVAVCLRMSDNELSFWECELDDDSLSSWSDLGRAQEISDIVLIYGVMMGRLSHLDVVFLQRHVLEFSGLELISTPEHGGTGVPELDRRHLDAVNLDNARVAIIADAIVASVGSGTLFRRFLKSEVKSVLQEAIDQRRIGLNHLQEKVRQSVL